MNNGRKTPRVPLIATGILLTLLLTVLSFTPTNAQGGATPTPVLQGDDQVIYGQESTVENPLIALQGDDSEIYIGESVALTNPLVALQGDDSEIYTGETANPLVALQGDDTASYAEAADTEASPATSEEDTTEPAAEEPAEVALSESLPLPNPEALALLANDTSANLADMTSDAWTQVTINNTALVVGGAVSLLLAGLGLALFVTDRKPS